MIIPEQEVGIKFWDEFYVKPYRIKFHEGPKDQERYVICQFALIKIVNHEPIVLKAYAFWQVEDLMRKYQLKVRGQLLDIHNVKLPKDDVFHVEGVLKSSIPSDFTGTTLDSIVFKVNEGKTSIDSSYDNLICINNIFTKLKVNDIIDQKFVEIAKELDSKLGIIIDMKSKTDVHSEVLVKDKIEGGQDILDV